VDVKRPGKQFFEAMEAKKVYIGRVWPAWPTHVRVTVGTGPEMEVFKKAFKEAMESPALAYRTAEERGVMANGSPIRESF